MKIYEDLPVVIVSDWDVIISKDFLEQKYD